MQKTYDPIRKQEVDFVYDLEETFKRGKHLSGHPLIRTGEYEKSLTTENQVDPLCHHKSRKLILTPLMNHTTVMLDMILVHLFDIKIH